MNLGKRIHFIDLIKIDNSLNNTYIHTKIKFNNVQNITYDLLRLIYFHAFAEKFKSSL